jgi:hypothetical protein
MLDRKTASLQIYVWFMKDQIHPTLSSSKPSLFTPFNKSKLSKNETSIDSVMTDRIKHFNATVYNTSDSLSKYNSPNHLDHIFHHTCIYKMDKHKEMDRAEDEFKIYKKLQYNEIIPSPYHVTPYLRGEQQYSTTLSRNSQSLQAMARSVPRGILLERCVGSLDDMIKNDRWFDNNMNFTCTDFDKYLFDWQPSALNDTKFNTKSDRTSKQTISSHNPKSSSSTSSSSPSTSSDTSQAILFRDLSIATCLRVSTDLRNIPSLLQHFHHLCKCVEFLHSKYIIHTDLKPQNIFVRTIDTSSTHVNKIQLILADFDIAIQGIHNGETHEIESSIRTTGTFGYHEAVYNENVTLADAIKFNTLAYTRTACTSVDIFSLGIMFLLMIYRIKFTTHLILWIKQDLVTKVCEQEKQDSTFKCSPAHVMLFHRSLKGITNATPNEIKRNQQVRSDVASNLIPKQLCDLLHAMTNILPEKRIKLKPCIEQIQLLLLSIK